MNKKQKYNIRLALERKSGKLLFSEVKEVLEEILTNDTSEVLK